MEIKLIYVQRIHASKTYILYYQVDTGIILEKQGELDGH